MKNNQTIGDLHRLQHGYSYDEHEFFYEFLLISPSYYKAHQFVTGRSVRRDVNSNISQWDLVLETYALCGNVYAMPFLGWWETVGRALFYTKQNDGTYLPQGSISLLNNKLNERTLIECLTLVNEKPRLEKMNSSRVENWRLGVECGIHSKWTHQLKGTSKKTHDNLEARTALGILVSKKIREALYIAENAARGVFPSLSHIDSGLAFDYPVIHELCKINLKLENEDKRNRIKLGERVPRSFFVRKVLPKQNKAKIIQIEVQKYMGNAKTKSN
jgi:hypothetical protein